MEQNLLEELKQKLEELKNLILENGIPKEMNLTDEQVKNVKENFNNCLDNLSDVRSVVYAINGALALTGTTIAIQSNLLILVTEAIEKGIFKDEEDFYNELKKYL